MPKSTNAFDEQRLLAERARVPIAFTRGEAHAIEYANSRFCELFGVATDRLRDASLASLFLYGSSLEPTLDRVYTSASTGFVHDLELRDGKGEFASADVVLSPICNSGSKERGLVVTVVGSRHASTRQSNEERAMDEMREANAQLLLTGLREQELADRAQQSADEMKALLENMREGVAVFDAQRNVVLINAIGRAVFGFHEGQPTMDAFRECDLRTLDGVPVDFDKDVLSRMLHDDQFVENELVLRSDDGRYRRVLLSGSAVRDERGIAVLAINVYRDVTELRELEQLREQYVCLISHDLRGPLSGARMASELLYRDLLTLEQRKRIAGQIIKKLDRMDRMVRDLLDAQRIRAGKLLPLRIDECDIVSIARDVVEELTSVHGDRFVLRAPKTIAGYWSGEELRRSIWNLASNAIKYGSPHTVVRIGIDQLPHGIALAVHNDGPPIPLEDQTGLFNAFSRTTAATDGGAGGWGLGLTLVRGCAEAHGGTVIVKSEAESGTTFTVTLPLDSRLHQGVPTALSLPD